MDPISAAIIGALAAGAVKGITKLGENVVVDAYNALKSALKSRFGKDKKLTEAIDRLEHQPTSARQQQALVDEIARAKADCVPELLSLASQLQRQVNIYQQTLNVKAGDNAVQNFGPGIGSISGNTIYGGININQTPAPPTASDLLQRGVDLFRMKSYTEALYVLGQSILTGPSADANYYLALATLQGQRPKTLTYSQADALKQRLRTACSLDSSKAHYWYFLALLEYDFFIENGFSENVEAVNDLLVRGNACTCNRGFVNELLIHAPARDCPVHEYLQSRL